MDVRRRMLFKKESGGNLITFTINSTEYQAEEGMTWKEWVDSEYSTNEYYANTYVYKNGWGLDLSGQSVLEKDIIIAEKNYTHNTDDIIGGGND